MRTQGRISETGQWLCIAGAGLGALGLIGWATGVSPLLTVVPDQPPLVPNTALGLLLIGVAGALRRNQDAPPWQRWLALLAALIVLAIGAATLAEYLFGLDLHIDEQIFRSPLGPHPGRPSPLTALALTSLALALLCFDVHPTARVRVTELLVLFAAVVAAVGLVGELLGAGPLYRVSYAAFIGVAPQSVLSLLLTSVGLLLERPAAGMMRVATSDGPGGVLLRHLLLPALLTPVLIGAAVARLFLLLHVANFVLMAATASALMIVFGPFLLMLTAAPLNRAHAALQYNREQTRSLIEQASDAIFVADLEGRYTDANAAAGRLLGCARDEIIGKTILDFIPQDQAARLAQVREELLAGGKTVSEWRMRRKRGDYVAVEVSANILPDGRWQALVRDISDRKAAEEVAARLDRELREARSFLENVLESSTEYGVIALDLERRIVLCNQASRRSFGYAEHELAGVSIDLLHAPEDLASGVAASAYACALDRGHTEVLRCSVRKDGSRFLSRMVVSRRLAGDGTPIGYLIVGRDVTREQRRSEQQRMLAEVGLLLTSSLDRRQVLQSVMGLLVRETADTCVADLAEQLDEDQSTRWRKVVHRDPQKADWSAALESYPLDPNRSSLGRSTLRAKETTLVAYVTPVFLDSLAQDARHRELLRELAPVSLISVPLQARGQPLGAITLSSSDARRRFGQDDVVFVEDLASRLALALDNARLFEVATKAVMARDEVLGVVAHDLRNPLSSASLAAGALLRSNGRPGPDTQRMVQRIQHAIALADRLIDDLLDITRIERTGGMAIDAKPAVASELVFAAVEMLGPAAAEAQVSLDVDIGPSRAQAWADPARVVQVLGNLISNALKFTPKGGHVRVAVERRPEEVRFAVTDTGPGIPREQLPHLFDRFWQARRVDRRGAGLGLAIARGIVDAHGGRIWAESEVDHGSRFTFALPLASDASSRPRAG